MATSNYKLRDGFRHFVSVTDDNGAVVSSRRMNPGETVELDDDHVQRANLMDRFEKVEDGGEKVVVQPTDPTRFTRSEKSDHQVPVNTESDGDDVVLTDDDEVINEGASTEGTNRELVSGAGTAPTGVSAGASAASTASAPASSSSSPSVGEMTVPQVKTHINSLSTKAEIRTVLDYEKANLQRQGVITAAETRMQQLDK